MAGRIPEDFISEVRSNVNIVDVISQYVSLEKKGKDYIGLCPFHQEKTPSFTVNADKQFFKCFGCGKGGNVFKFLMYKDDLTFPESVERVAEFAHIAMPNGYGHNSGTKLNPLMQMHQDAVDFYHRVLLTTKAGERGMQYAQKRELDQEILDHFKIGYAPKADNVLITYLRSKGYQDDDLAQSGLFVQARDGQLYDRFRDRLMFPLDNENGRTIGFSGRRISDDKTEAKYMNSPETEIFTKSKVLFHFAEAKKAARGEGHLVLYEGYMDVIAAYKAGVKSGIASMGTSLTDDQIYLLRRITPNIIINYDGDDPGVHAEERAARMFNKDGNFNLGIVVLPEKLDPDEYVKKYGAEKYLEEVKGALTPTDFFLKRLEQKYNLDNDREKIAYLGEALKEIAQVRNPVEQDMYTEKLAKSSGVSIASLKANLAKERRRNNRARNHVRNSQRNSPDYPIDVPLPGDEDVPTEQSVVEKNPSQTRLLYLFIHSTDAQKYMLEGQFHFPNQDFETLAQDWLKYAETHENPQIDGFLDFIPEQLQGIIVDAEMAQMPKDSTIQEVDALVLALKRRNIYSRLNELQAQLQDAKRKNDAQGIIAITQEIIGLKRILG
ncbi:DNA primase [Lactobacillus crispatus]|uniref:DNA primase n=1 Tax=Lactobacillus crispatus TaxID=47770 RepID=UPI000C7D563C|nr:DNA primase [Lactobacillus crispatus]KAA8789839.1 DNA primase [Lactobacillus crispatus]KAA8789956.1 DNA primase [Lactobacillus crispatus]MDK7320164.1 DNA primase [Lactobacillus crispatus]MDK8272552.1 DNA primase [Lactobacillus crispatus]MDK8568633.1 DNA primase [Lactobacillus crispatus]